MWIMSQDRNCLYNMDKYSNVRIERGEKDVAIMLDNCLLGNYSSVERAQCVLQKLLCNTDNYQFEMPVD